MMIIQRNYIINLLVIITKYHSSTFVFQKIWLNITYYISYNDGLESTKVVSAFSEEDTDSHNNKKKASQEEEKAKHFAETTEIFSFLFLPS